MGEIKRVDYFCGAFLSYLVSNKIAPTLFEAGESSKIVRFLTGKKDYKIYLKYSTKKKVTRKANKNYSSWEIIFTEKEFTILKSFHEDNRVLFVVCVCTNEKLSKTDFAVISYEDALKCLGHDDINKQKRLTITHQKASSKMYCYGTALSDENAIEIPHDYNKCFNLIKETDNNDND